MGREGEIKFSFDRPRDDDTKQCEKKSISQFNICSVFAVNNEVLPQMASPPHNNAVLNQRDLLITQPSSIPSSPLASPSGHSSTSFCLQSPSGASVNNIASNQENDDPTTDPNWQATKPTVRERNAAMFNNELMADIKFIVGCDGMCIVINMLM